MPLFSLAIQNNLSFPPFQTWPIFQGSTSIQLYYENFWNMNFFSSVKIHIAHIVLNYLMVFPCGYINSLIKQMFILIFDTILGNRVTINNIPHHHLLQKTDNIQMNAYMYVCTYTYTHEQIHTCMHVYVYM